MLLNCHYRDGLDPNQAMIPERRATMKTIGFILSIIGFGLEVTAFLLTVAIL